MIKRRYIFKAPHAHLLIPKVATSTTSAILQNDLNWGTSPDVAHLNDPAWIKEAYPHLEPCDDWSFSSLVRHPLDRWVSGMAQKYAGAACGRDLSDENKLRVEALYDDERLGWYVRHPVHDEHTERQSDHLSEVIPEVVLFKMENIDELWVHLGIEPKEVHLHRTSGYQEEVAVHLRESIYRVPEYAEALSKFYRRDLVLYKIAYKPFHDCN